MKLKWKQFRVFGTVVTLPAIIIIVQQLSPEQVEQFRAYKAGMAECPKCHRLFGGRAGLSFITHLQDEHGMDSFKSMDVVSELYKGLLVRINERRAANETSAVK